MTDFTNNLPPLIAPEDVERQAGTEELRPYLLDPTLDYPEPYYMLEFNGVPFSTIGGIQALSGQKKNGKSFVMAQLMAAILGQGSARVAEYLPGLKVPQRTLDYLGHLPTVLYVDTEMEKLNSAKVLRRVHWLCGWQMDQPSTRFHVLWLRGVTDEKDDKGQIKIKAYAKRLRLTMRAIAILKPDAVFIDGIRDIMADFNNLEESGSLISELMATAERNQCCIWNTLHLNPRPGNDDESKMRGHAGTELGNKVTDTLISIKKKDSATGDVTFTVKQQDARGKDMDDWKFEVTDDAGGLGIPKIIGSGTSANASNTAFLDVTEVKQLLTQYQSEVEWPAKKGDIRNKIFKQKGGVSNSDKLQNMMAAAINRRFILEEPADQRPAGTNYPRFVLNREEIKEDPF